MPEIRDLLDDRLKLLLGGVLGSLLEIGRAHV